MGNLDNEEMNLIRTGARYHRVLTGLTRNEGVPELVTLARLPSHQATGILLFVLPSSGVGGVL